MNRMIAALLFVVALASTPTPVAALRESKYTTSNVYLFSDSTKVPGATSSVTTNEWGARATLFTNMLSPNDMVTLWWVIFNHPNLCTHPTAVSRCSEGDFDIHAVEAAVVYGGGRRVSGGSASFSAYLGVDDISEMVFGEWGLHHPLTADIHLVVRSHGQLIPELLGSQLTTFGGGCNNTPDGTGTPGPNTCTDVQYSVHQQ